MCAAGANIVLLDKLQRDVGDGVVSIGFLNSQLSAIPRRGADVNITTAGW
jgi:hypothetical protein